jgi:hypothetical protein
MARVSAPATLAGPTAHPVDPEVFAMRLGFDLAPEAVYVAAFVLVRFDDARVEAADLRVSVPDPAPASVCVLADGVFGWTLGDPEGNSPIPLTGEVYAALRGPVGVEAFTGTARLDVSTLRSAPVGARRKHLRATGSVRFTLSPPDGWTGTVAEHGKSRRSAAVRLCLAADMQRYSRFGTPEALRAQQRFVAVLARARRHAGIDENGVDLQQSGDGEFAILPAGLDESVVIPRLVEGLRAELARTNSDLSDRARLRLRVALHRGHVAPGPNGWAGTATIAVHRLLDSDVLREALAGRPGADFALIVPDLLYRDVIVDHCAPAEFTPVDATVPAKGFAERAWIHLGS